MLAQTSLRRALINVAFCSLLATAAVGQTPDFTLSITTRGPYVARTTALFPIAVTAVNGFNSPVSLTCVGPGGDTCIVQPTTMWSGSGTGYVQIYMFNTGAGRHSVTVRGTSGSLEHTATISFDVTDYTLSISPASRTAVAGGRVSFTITVTPINGFNGGVTFECGWLCSVTPSTIYSGTGIVEFSVPGNIEPRTHSVPLRGSSLGRTQQVYAEIVVQGFTLQASGTPTEVAVGGTARFNVRISAQNGFAAPVTLACTELPANWSCLFSPNPAVTSSELVVATNSPAGTYAVVFKGTAGGAMSSSWVDVAVRAPDFTVAVSPQNLTVVPGERAQFDVGITPRFGFSAPVSMSCAGLPPQIGCSFEPNPAQGSTRLTLTTTLTTAQETTPFQVRGVSGAGSRTANATIQVRNTPGSFSMRATPESRTVAAGDWGTFLVDITGDGTFRGAVRLACSQLPAGARCDFSENPAGVGQLRLTVLTTAATPMGTASVQLSADNGSVIRAIPLQLTVVPPVLTIRAGAVDTTSCPEIQFPITVTGGNGEPVAVLTATNFTLREDGEPRALTLTGTDGGYLVRYRTGDAGTAHSVTLAATYGAQTGSVTMRVSQCGCALPYEPSLSIALQPGFYIAEVTSAGKAGTWGMEVLAQRGELAGGFNLGGAVQEGGQTAGFGAFYLPDAQSVTARVAVQPAIAGGQAMGPTCVRLLDSERRQIGTDTCGRDVIQFTRQLTAGFYIVEVLNSPASPRATFQLGLSATYFAGGVVVGGFSADGLTGFGAFYLPDDQGTQEVRIRVLGLPSYGNAGACRLQLRVLDSSRNVVRTQP